MEKLRRPSPLLCLPSSLLLVLTVFLTSLALAQTAQPPAQPLAAFLQAAYQRDTAYQDAERALASAQDELRKTQGDPEAAQLALTRAQENVAVAQAKLAQARRDADARAVEAYTGVLVAQADVQLAQNRKALSELQLRATNLRFEAGAVSAAEVARVRDQDAQAATAVRTAQRGLDQAQARLRPFGEVRPQALGEPGPVDVAKFSATGHARLQEAAQQVREAERALSLASGPDTAPLDKTARERDLARAQAALADLQRTLTDALEAAKRRYQSALDGYRVARETQTRTANELTAAQRRFQAGSIAQTVLRQAEITKEEADRSAVAALAEIWSAIYGLQSAGAQQGA